MLFSSRLHVTYAWMLLSSPRPLFPQGMMGAYGPPYMPMQGPHEGLLSVAPMSPHTAGGPHLLPHHFQQGMPGYPGMLHQGKGHCPSHTCSVTSSRVSPAGGVYLVHTGCTAWCTRWAAIALWSPTVSLKVYSHTTPHPYTHSQI